MSKDIKTFVDQSKKKLNKEINLPNEYDLFSNKKILRNPQDLKLKRITMPLRVDQDLVFLF